ncbi:hypothetical protein [Altericista sp. CCNU0014]|uniref:hypothetical protein n=1 Tax=Altericista sp. CCNU0014 TaxID=3082949 RepID=UPI00384EEC1D
MSVPRPLRRRVAIAVLLALLWIAAMALPAAAAQCQSIAGREVCVLNLRRSAKHYWEYWAQLSIDGIKQPERIYDCRVFSRGSSSYIPPELTAETVKVESIGSLVCRLYRN